jgi:hypothetical protein
VDWNWSLGTGPTTFTTSGSGDWALGAATNGPADGLTWLGTAPGQGYPNNANDWVRLPVIDLSAHLGCQFRLTVELWRSAERVGVVNYDGGNLQYTVAAAGNTGWAALDGAGMAYDGTLPQCGGSCLVAGQNVWTSTGSPKAKTAVYTAAAPPGASLWLRFTFTSDSDNSAGALPGIFVRRVLVEAY